MRAALVLPMLLLLPACGGGDAPSSKDKSSDAPAGGRRSVSSELPKGVKPSSEVLETRKIAGVWRSSPGAVQDLPKQSVQLEIAFDKTFTMTLWGKDPKGAGEAVFARQSGRIGFTKEGFAGSASGAKASGISRLASWSAKVQSDGTLLIAAPGSSSIVMRRMAN